MKRITSFFVHGQPKPQGSMRAFTNPSTGRPIITSNSKGMAPWRRLIADVAQQHAHMYEGPVMVKLDFIMPRPKSLPKSHDLRHPKRPDSDKLARAALDALTGVMFNDDSQVDTLLVTKRYAPLGGATGLGITIGSLLPYNDGDTDEGEE